MKKPEMEENWVRVDLRIELVKLQIALADAKPHEMKLDKSEQIRIDSLTKDLHLAWLKLELYNRQGDIPVDQEVVKSLQAEIAKLEPSV